MAGKAPDPLTPADAKERLRHAAQEACLSTWITRHPYRAMLFGLAAGVILGNHQTRDLLALGVSRQIKRSLNR